jgi:hypothetical protein
MPDLGPMGRGGARRRTRRRMTAVNEMQNSKEQPENEAMPDTGSSDKLEKLAKLLKSRELLLNQNLN